MSKKGEESNHDEDDNGNNTPPAATAAAKPAVASSSIAEALYAVETLVQVFGFSVEAANQAVNEVGTDVSHCYNFILDQGLGKDTGGAVYPIDNCPHIHTHVTTTTTTTTKDQILLGPGVFQEECQYHSGDSSNNFSFLEKTGNLKEDVVLGDQSLSSCPKGENWLCLTCSRVFCSRYVNGHGLQHWKDTCAAAAAGQQQQEEEEEDTGTAVGHCVALSLADLSVWCHVCGAYLVHDEKVLKPIVKYLEQLKFADEQEDGSG